MSASSSKEAESLAYFQMLTNADERTAKYLLEAAQGDREVAVDLYFSTLRTDGDYDHTQTRIKRSTKDDTNAGIISGMHTLGLHNGESVGNSSDKVEGNANKGIHQRQTSKGKHVLKHIGMVENCFAEDSNTINGSVNASSRIKDSTAASKVDIFNKFPSPAALCQKNDLFESFERAKKMKQWLLLHVQCAEDFRSYQINRDIWRNTDLVNLILKFFTFWVSIQPYGTATFEHHLIKYKDQKYAEDIFRMSTPALAIVNPWSKELHLEIKFVQSTSAENLMQLLKGFLDKQPELEFRSAEKNEEDCTKITQIPKKVEEYNVYFRFPTGLVLSHKFHSCSKVQVLYDFVRNTKLSSQALDSGKKIFLKYIFQCIHKLDNLNLTLEDINIKNRVVIVTYIK